MAGIISCSDSAMNGPEDCGLLQGDGKGDDSSLVNLWQLEGLSGNGVTLDCTPTPPAPAELCEAEAAPAASCETLDKPTSLTFRYSGGTCLDSANDQGSKTSCSGSVDGAAAATVTSTAQPYSHAGEQSISCHIFPATQCAGERHSRRPLPTRY